MPKTIPLAIGSPCTGSYEFLEKMAFYVQPNTIAVLIMKSAGQPGFLPGIWCVYSKRANVYQ
jgi:hypothetical protein